MTEQFLPVGIQSFERMRTGGFLYVDKTRFLHEMVRAPQGFYFLSRPRRFGKSLTVSTLKCLFQGKKELFDGLWISRNAAWAWDCHPVICFDFNGISHETPEIFREGLFSSLRQSAGAFGISLSESLLKEQFRELILAAYRATGRGVVILIDEYDKPLIDHLGRGAAALETAKANRDLLKRFLGVLKDSAASDAIRFVFITGVSKFSRVSIFSELNNLEDITMMENYAGILGYTQAELEECFNAHIAAMAKKRSCTEKDLIEKLNVHYNGYRFSRDMTRVYNPFSILSALKQQAVRNYWFETGTPTFLVNMLKKSSYPLPRIERLELDETAFSTYELENLKPEALLFQTGYITIRDVVGEIYTFTYPNQEVKIAFLKHLLADHFPLTGAQARFLNLALHLRQEAFDAFFETIHSIFAGIPYALASKRDEAYFHTLFYLMVSASGIDAASEVLTCDGRIDLVMRFPDTVFIIEFKCNQSAGAALKQIRDMRYPDRFRQSGSQIVLMGINFDTAKRNLSEWQWERA